MLCRTHYKEAKEDGLPVRRGPIPKRTVCRLPWCGRKEYAKGLCGTHYNHNLIHGHPFIRCIEREWIKCAIEGCRDEATSKGMCPKHYGRVSKHGNPFFVNEEQKYGEEGELRVQQLLRHYGRTTKKQGKFSAFDLLVDGKWRVEVKTCRPLPASKFPEWNANLHRHNILNEEGVDYYVIRLEGGEGLWADAVHLLFKAPVKATHIRLTLRSLVNGYQQHVQNFYYFSHGDFDRLNKYAG